MPVVLCQQLARLLALISDESIVLWELLIDMNTVYVENKPVLSLLSRSGSEEGSNGQQMMPELLNEVFSAKATQLMHTHTHRTTTVITPMAHALRVNDCCILFRVAVAFISHLVSCLSVV